MQTYAMTLVEELFNQFDGNGSAEENNIDIEAAEHLSDDNEDGWAENADINVNVEVSMNDD